MAIGRPDAGTISSGGNYSLRGGFWHGAMELPPTGNIIFQDDFED